VYYSIGLEAFSVTGKDEENFFETIETVFPQLELSGLTADRSWSYPEFLALI
jgi:hypothetical protein